MPTLNDMIDNDAYIHKSFGLTVTGTSVKLRILPIADVNRKSDMTMDFMEAGA